MLFVARFYELDQREKAIEDFDQALKVGVVPDMEKQIKELLEELKK